MIYHLRLWLTRRVSEFQGRLMEHYGFVSESGEYISYRTMPRLVRRILRSLGFLVVRLDPDYSVEQVKQLAHQKSSD